MKKISLKKGQMRAIKAKTLKNVFCFENFCCWGVTAYIGCRAWFRKTLNYVVQLKTQKGCQTIEINDQELL
jgi:hypothetical protein